jgi:hypothetical protein
LLQAAKRFGVPLVDNLISLSPKTITGLNILADCTMDVKKWYLINGLQLNADKSEVMLVGTAYQLRVASEIKSVSVAGSMLPVATKIKTL